MNSYREEFYVRLFRCWLIVSTLQSENTAEEFLDIEKCSFIDYLITNPPMLKKCLHHFNRGLKLIDMPETWYPSNIEFGEYQETNEFIKCVLYLSRHRYLEIEKRESVFILKKGLLDFPLQMEIVHIWENNIRLIKPLLSKSISILHKSILADVNHE